MMEAEKDYRNNDSANELLLLSLHKVDLKDLQRGYEVLRGLLRNGLVGDAEWLCEEMFGAVEYKIKRVEKSMDMWEELGSGDKKEG